MYSDSDDDLYQRTNKKHQAILKRHEEIDNNFQLTSEVLELSNLSDDEILSQTTDRKKRNKRGKCKNESIKKKKVESLSGESSVEEPSKDEMQILYSCLRNKR